MQPNTRNYRSNALRKNELPGENFQQKCLKKSDTIEKTSIVYNLFIFMYT